MSLNWELLRELKEKFDKQPVKVIYNQDKNRQTVLITGEKIEKVVWELFDSGVKSIMLVDSSNNTLFEYTEADRPIHSQIYGSPGFMGQIILNWKNVSPRVKDLLIEMLTKDIQE